MTTLKSSTSLRATLIGDVVDSRGSADRQRLHRDLTVALTSLEGDPLEPPRFTVGDEFQGSYATVGAALSAAWSIRLAVAPDIDIRCGIGWGAVNILDAATGIQDGPGWWSARAAIEWAAQAQRQPGFALVRMRYLTEMADGPSAAPVNAALMCRDHMFGSLDERSVRILRGLVSDSSKRALADVEGISPSAVSQRVGRDGLDLIVVASQYLSEVT